MTFEELHKKFEKKETNLYTLQKESGFSKYILVRSLGKDHLTELIKTFTKEYNSKDNTSVLYEKLYSSKATIDDIISYINKKYPQERKDRKEKEAHLPKIIKEFGDVKCGVRNDNLNDTAKELVRDKSIKSKAGLESKIDDLFNSTIKGYILWQYYNQVTNDLIEHIFNDHENVIPTLRKIKYVDFMIKKGDQIIPFDLKITHISDSKKDGYFDLHKKGLKKSEHEDNSYLISDKKSEIDIIKEKYKSVKKQLKLPHYGSLTKGELLENLTHIGNEETKEFVASVIKSRRIMVSEIENNLMPVEWWNYKFQGERLFKNNNRFFIFLVYKDSFEDARPLKGNISEISIKVKEKLDSILEDKLHNIKYYYEKDKGLEGAYQILSTSVIITKELKRS